MSDVLISVVIPTYHRNDLLAKCLACLAPGTQTMDASRYEVIVTDDGKTSTAERMIAEQFPWARWVKGPQRGPAANRNNGAKYARGQWIAFTDDDCLPSAGWLERYADAIEPDIQIYEGKTTCRQGVRPWYEEAPVNLQGGCLWSCNMMVARDLYELMGGFDEAYPTPMMEDVDFNERATRAGTRVKWVPEALIDHPPRPRRTALVLGKSWESRALFVFKYHLRKSVSVWLPIHVMKVRISEMLHTGLRREVLAGARTSLFEFGYVWVHARGWQKKYRSRYSS